MTIIEELGCDTVIDAAYLWLCKRGRDYPANADIWSFRFDWANEKSRIQRGLLSSDYRFEPLSQVTNGNGEVLHLWSARDALVLKALTAVLRHRLPVSQRCVHVKGHGGCKSHAERGLSVNFTLSGVKLGSVPYYYLLLSPFEVSALTNLRALAS